MPPVKLVFVKLRVKDKDNRVLAVREGKLDDGKEVATNWRLFLEMRLLRPGSPVLSG